MKCYSIYILFNYYFMNYIYFLFILFVKQTLIITFTTCSSTTYLPTHLKWEIICLHSKKDFRFEKPCYFLLTEILYHNIFIHDPVFSFYISYANELFIILRKTNFLVTIFYINANISCQICLILLFIGNFYNYFSSSICSKEVFILHYPSYIFARISTIPSIPSWLTLSTIA